ncbi:SDR family NAD(P)-dependent oxidoreductase [Salegentibacter salegens]|uniref:NAD(P)-dependent dehydrogenase, short-chain alcohol dehydrogenase family n=1 Tax=Salegentibacter salegens TaxID=143223 RepID=A0A1M7JIR3_9FLAO|nr:SDR family oxidoreductase [Salegentibacter salegens]PRX40630.1 NAD(P)-dependent dehydrogenase (short-subunit alcohol dehydrogenase family) [Salegentibacter salegens]SHM52904.1 NAD(P)-dependent dehydrogenase, short-chain alcohol dehydrogenase family [Salegentibacter salegens]
MKKNILLIGGSTGIGLEIANQLVIESNVIVASRNKGELNDDIKHLEFDVLKDNIEDLELPEEIHGLVYCPGSINLKPFKILKHKDFEEEMNLNFLSLVKVVQGVMPKLKEAENASLVFFSTVAVKVGMPFHTSVAAAKGAIEGFAKSLAAEYAPSLRVNVIAPSLTDTPLAEKLLSNDSKKEKMSERHPLKRVGNAKDIANAATFLLSDENSWITGQIIGVDGGLSTLNIS